MKAGPSSARTAAQRSQTVRIFRLMTPSAQPCVIRYVARLIPNPLDPGGNGGEAAKVEAPFVGDVGVGVEGDVGDRVAVSDEEFTLSEVPLHHPEGGVAQFPLGLQREPTFLGYLYVVGDPKPRRGDVGFVAVLLDVLSPFTETTPHVSN